MIESKVKMVSKMKKKKITLKDMETSDEYLFEAYEENDELKKVDLLKKALGYNPDNIDALLALNHMEDDPFSRLSILNSIIPHAYKLLEKEGFISEEYIGKFWGFHETRPYMRARHDQILSLIDVGYYFQAVAECMELLMLCENDNQGIRYILMEIYAIVGDENGAKWLSDKFDEVTFQFLFPYAVLMFRQEKLKESKALFEKLFEKYPYAKDIIIKNKKPDAKTLESMVLGVPMFQPGEVYYTLMEMQHLLTDDFLKWFKSEFGSKSKKN